MEDALDARNNGDLDDDSVYAAGISGYAVVAAVGSPRAYLFALVGSASEAIPLPLPAPNSSSNFRVPRLAMWTSDTNRLAIAALDLSGSLRVYSNVNPDTRSSARPQELRVARALALSARVEDIAVDALDLVHVRGSDGRDALFVFGGRESAAIVRLGEFSPNVEPLERFDPAVEAGKRSGITFGKLFHAALRSISGDSRPDAADFETGTGVHRIVGKGAVKSIFGACVVRSGGTVELWGSEKLLWCVDLFNLIPSKMNTSDRRVVSAAVSVDDSIICLVQEVIGEAVSFRVIGFAASNEPPQSIALEIDLGQLMEGDSRANVFMTLSEGIAYFHVPGTNHLTWVSVARGIEEIDQVRGNISFSERIDVLCMLDASLANRGRNPETVLGGCVACLCSDAVHMVSSGVPAPLSVQGGQVVQAPTALNEEQNISTLLWIAHLQFSAGQIGASRAGLRTFYRSIHVNDSPSITLLSEVVHETCLRIISSTVDPSVQPMALLIDTELEKRQGTFNSFLRLLGDAEVFAGIREDAHTITDDRLWDVISPDVRHAVLCHGEKLAAALAIRKVENSNESGNTASYHREPGATSIIGSEVIGTRTGSEFNSMCGEGLREVEAVFTGGTSIISKALQQASSRVGSNSNASDSASFLYRYPIHFHLFLPALRDCLVDVFTKARQQQEFNALDANTIQRALRAMTERACKGALAVSRAARETRAGFVADLERDPYELRSFQDWCCGEETRGALEVFVESALERCSGGRQQELDMLHRRAAEVTDELLACTRLALSDAEVSPSVSGTNLASSSKRRRIFEGDCQAPWGRARRKALERLRSARLVRDTLKQAEKYRDFGMIMILKTKDDDFDEYFAKAVEHFGDEFGFYAFRWLEEEGEVKLLLKGKGLDPDGSRGMRTERLNNLLSNYFDEERASAYNLEWMHWLSQDNVPKAIRALCNQTRAVSEPGRPNSLESSKVLASVAKLCVIASNMEEMKEVEEHGMDDNFLSSHQTAEDSKKFIQGVLYLAEVQTRLNEGRTVYDAMLEPEELVEKYVNEAPIESKKLSEHITVALEAVKFSRLDEKKAVELSDRIWRRCVQREAHIWQVLSSEAQNISDQQLRVRLQNTALYLAAVSSKLGTAEMRGMMERRTFDFSDLDGSERIRHGQLEPVLREAVKLAQMV